MITLTDALIAYQPAVLIAYLQANFPSLLDEEGTKVVGLTRVTEQTTTIDGVAWVWQPVRLRGALLSAEELATFDPAAGGWSTRNNAPIWQYIASEAASSLEVLAQAAYDRENKAAVYDALAAVGGDALARYRELALEDPVPIHAEDGETITGYDETPRYAAPVIQ